MEVISTSNRAKATTLVILSIALGFGMYAMVLNTSNLYSHISRNFNGNCIPCNCNLHIYTVKHPRSSKTNWRQLSAMAAATWEL